MTKPVRFTRAAEASLGEIADWTLETFGVAQALRYEAELLARCAAIAEGTAHSRDCSALAPKGRGLRYVWASEHFLVYAERADDIVIVEVLHSRSDLLARLAKLAGGPS